MATGDHDVCPVCGREQPCPLCGDDGDYARTGEPVAERIHFFARMLWTGHKLRLNLQESGSVVLADEMSDIIRRAEKVQELAAKLGVH